MLLFWWLAQCFDTTETLELAHYYILNLCLRLNGLQRVLPLFVHFTLCILPSFTDARLVEPASSCAAGESS